MEESQKCDVNNFKVPLLISKPSGNVETTVQREDDKSQKSSIDSQNINQTVPIPYNEPSWSSIPTDKYNFEVIKSGVIISNFSLLKSFIVIGRLTTCDISLEHPSVSRYHAILQYCGEVESRIKGYYIYDLGSTHGTFLNKERIAPRTYYLVKNGHVLKFGGSTRLHILQGPEDEDMEIISKEQSTDIPTKENKNNKLPDVPDESCSWGMGDDAEEEEEGDLSVNPFAVSTENEDLYIDDPKKTLRGWFEREGYELEYNVEERGFRTFACIIRLPIDTPTSDYLNVEAAVQGKKKEAVVACALEACRTLDRHGLLRQSHQSSRERKRKNWEEEDFYDSDDDTYLDRTGAIEKKRQVRMMQVKKPEPETFNSLEKKLQELNENITTIESKLQLNVSENLSQTKADDPLDSYMSEINNESIDKITKSKLKLELTELLQEKTRVERLLNIVKPAKLPERKFPNMIGKKIKTKLKLPSPAPRVQNRQKDDGLEVEEEEDDEKPESTKSIPITEKVTEKPEKLAKDISLPVTKDDVLEKDKEVKTKTPDKQFPDSSTSHSNLKEEKLLKFPKSPINKKTDAKKFRPIKVVKKDVYKTNDENYSMWMPPTDQSGDGSTHLNLKYGY